MEKINSISSLNKNKRTKTNSYFNRLVPKLLEQSNKLTKELENRMKLNSFFAEFETKAFNQFNFFLKESLTRYRGTRSGCNLDSLISSSRKKCLKVANNIINDKFYSNNEITTEKEKMKYKTTKRIYKSFRETLSKLKGITKSVSVYDLKENALKKKIPKKKKNLKNKFNLTIMSSEKLDKGKNDIKSLLNTEKLSLYKTMDNYRKDLNKLNTINENKKYSFAHKNMLLNLPKLNLLTYKKFVPPSLNPDEDDELNRVNFKKLLPYSRLGKNLGISPKNIKEKNKKIQFMTEPKFCLSSSKYNTYIKSIKNTNEIVLSSANREFDIESRINSKRKMLEDILCVDSIPKLDSYEAIVKNMFNKRKIERNMKKRIIINFLILKKKKNHTLTMLIIK